jgi:hypothetical protein
LDYQRSLALKAKAHLFGLGALVYGGRALAPSPGVGVAACARAAAVAAFGAAAAKICTKMWGFSAISAVVITIFPFHVRSLIFNIKIYYFYLAS